MNTYPGKIQKWRNDGKCGGFNLLPNARAAECDPDGDKPCCSNNLWGGVCGQDCYCMFCKDYKLLKEWRVSNGTKKWRYDGKCGINYLLPDGTPAQCDPEGDKPCCSDIYRGECGNTTEHCDCGNTHLGGSIWKECLDYRPIYSAWNKSKGKQRWAEDGRCGKKFRLPDGAPMECDPDSEKPCCDHWDNKCKGHFKACLCTECVDYRLVRTVRESGKSCTVAGLESSYLKYACFDEKSHRQHFKCTNSDVTYKLDNYGLGELRNVTASCDNDPHAYQVCGFSRKITQSDVLCGGYFCNQKRNQIHNYIQCTGNHCKAENRNCIASGDNTKNCDDNDICDSGGNCKLNEGNCNGYIYGVYCNWQGGDYLPLSKVCDGRGDCFDSSDEIDCHRYSYTRRTVSKCSRFSERRDMTLRSTKKCSIAGLKKNDLTVYVEPFCGDYSGQANCSDFNRVGGYCEINNIMTNISKYVVCYESDFSERSRTHVKLCDDNFQNNCLSPHPACKIHKHKMCDGTDDCIDGTDEVHDMCKTMTDLFECTRRFRFRRGEFKIPVSWIMDNEIDCLDGEDENAKRWKNYFCQGEFIIFTKPGRPCKDVYKCPGDAKSYVPLEQLCDGVESCGDGAENAVCNIARDFPVIKRSAAYNGTVRNLCNSSTQSCTIKEFKRPWGSVFGEQKIELSVPESKVNCSKLYGEHYLFLSCMNLCEESNANCLLDDENRKLEYNSCPGQYFNRSYTLANNSYLTFVDKSDSGQYHQDFFQCNNSKCVEYKQVCDLVDDCGDMSDEENCVNHMICKDSLNSSKHQYISLSQRCDGIYDCFDLSDECNESCNREILKGWVLKCTCWLMGILALFFNSVSVYHGITSILHECKTEKMMTTKVLISLIATGDFLMGLYLILLSIFDSLIHGSNYCKHQPEWLTGTPCLMLGIISTIGSQISLFSMTALSFIRMFGLICIRMRIPGPINTKSIMKATCLATALVVASLATAVIPLIPFLEDYFVQGMYYDPAHKLMIGFPNKDRHIGILKAYYDRNMTGNASTIASDLTWSVIREKVDGMFSQDHGELTRYPVHFYGNDGVCLFKYFVRTDDARRSRNKALYTRVDSRGDIVVWMMLVVNFICFVVITVCYIAITVDTTKSSQSSGQCDIPERIKENKAMQRRITLVIVTDFLCWIPIIMISSMHNLRKIDASSWYVPFAMTVLPLNSVINPLLYDKVMWEFIKKKIRQIKVFISDKLSIRDAFIRMFRRNNEVAQEEEIPMEIIRRYPT